MTTGMQEGMSQGIATGSITDIAGIIMGQGNPSGTIPFQLGSTLYYDSANQDVYMSESGTSQLLWNRLISGT